MKKRCYDSSCPAFVYYGGRGIKVCHQWQQFKPFYEWAIVNGYQKGLFLDRIENDKGYEPANCRFVTSVESNRNRRFCKLNRETVVEICDMLRDGATKRAVAWWFGIHEATLSDVLLNKTWKFIGDKSAIKMGNGKITMDNATEIRKLKQLGHSGTALAKQFGLSEASISRIVHNQTWKTP